MQRILLITLAALVCLTGGCNKDDEVLAPVVNPGGDDPDPSGDTGAIQRLITASSTEPATQRALSEMVKHSSCPMVGWISAIF